MRRENCQPRDNYLSKIEQFGLTFHTLNGKPYWFEEACYALCLDEVNELEQATNELHARCLDVVDHVITNRQYSKFGLPESTWSLIEKAWEEDPPSLYGRFDLCFGSGGPPKLLEFNADTPTSLLEAAVIQWQWLQEVNPSADQFNSIWDALIAKWQALKEERCLGPGLVHFASMDWPEDTMTTAVLMDTAQEAGLGVNYLQVDQIGWDEHRGIFVDQNLNPIHTLFKLYPWEWMFKDEFFAHLSSRGSQTQWIEPIWKAILSNKALLAMLWELFPDHPNLLPAYLDGPNGLQDYVCKPLLGREGQNVSITGKVEVVTAGDYADTGWVYQQYCPLPVFDGNHVVVGSWVVDCESCGVGFRESDGPVTGDDARFVPHYILPTPTPTEFYP